MKQRNRLSYLQSRIGGYTGCACRHAPLAASSFLASQPWGSGPSLSPHEPKNHEPSLQNYHKEIKTQQSALCGCAHLCVCVSVSTCAPLNENEKETVNENGHNHVECRQTDRHRCTSFHIVYTI